MNLADFEKQLHAEGFGKTCVWQDGPNANYADQRIRARRLTLFWKAR